MIKYYAQIKSCWDNKFILFQKKNKKCTIFGVHNCVVYIYALNVVA